jgi:hypothetical protein
MTAQNKDEAGNQGPVRPISQEQFDEVCRQAGVDPAELSDSGSSQPLPPPLNEIDTASTILYAWQMLNDQSEWNIIGLMTPQGQTLPMVTTSFDVAWQAFDIAQEHANRHNTRCRLASFKYETVMAIVEPDDHDPDRG